MYLDPRVAGPARFTLLAACLTGGLCLLTPDLALAQLPAFPTAVGFGAVATGGRGGRVIHVTTLAASGAGSLAAAASASGARIIVFDVSGVIEGDVEITNGDVTIAGQTAPGAGITIHGHLFTPYNENPRNFIIRHIRVRPPGSNANWPPTQHDAIQMSDAHQVIFDHVDASHGIDENVDHWNGGTEITWQNSIVSFPNPAGGHPDGSHPFCLINSDGETGGGNAGGKITLVGNLFAHCRARSPALSIGPAEVINNVMYGTREAFVHHNPAYGDFVATGNYFKDGPSFALNPFWFDAENSSPPTRYFLGDNWVDDPGVFTGRVDNPYTTSGYAAQYAISDTVSQSQVMALASAPSFPSPHVNVARATTTQAYDRVLMCSGAWPRDFVSKLAVQETMTRTGTSRLLALTNLMDGLTAGAAPADGDRDGMPDAWEQSHGLNPAVDDHSTAMAGGWPALEVYLEELATSLACQTTTPIPTGAGGSSGTTGAGGSSGTTGGGGSSGAGTGGRGGSSGAGTGGRGGSTGAGTGGRGGSSGVSGAGGSSGSVSGAGGSSGSGSGAGGSTVGRDGGVSGTGSRPAVSGTVSGGCSAAGEHGGSSWSTIVASLLVAMAGAVALGRRRRRSAAARVDADRRDARNAPG